MDDSRGNRSGLIVVIVVVLAALGAWWCFQRPATVKAVDETLDVFVPDAEAMDRRTGYIGEARQLVDTINARQAPERRQARSR